MKVELDLTNDEYQWLEEVTNYGAELTRYMLRKKLLPKGKSWDDIQFEVYEKFGKGG